MAQKIVGIDIGSYSIKIAEVTSSAGGAILNNYSAYKITQSPQNDDNLEVIDTLRRFIENFDTDTTQIIVAVPQQYIAHRHAFFALKERHSIQNTLAFELEEEVPFNVENAVFDAKITSYTANGTNVLASICLKERIENVLDFCKDCGFEPHIVSCETLALANLFEEWATPPKESHGSVENLLNLEEDQEDSGTSAKKATQTGPRTEAGALIHLGNNKSLLLIYKNGELVTCRSFSWGGSRLASEIHKTYDLPLSESIRELNEKGFLLVNTEGATDAQKLFSSTLAKGLDGLAHKMKVALLDIESEFHLEIKKISLSGGVSRLKNIGPFLTQQFNIATNPIDLPLPHITVQAAEFDKVGGGVALGLAIEGLKRPRNPATNFLKGPFARANKSLELFKDRWGKTLRVSSALFFILLFHSCTRVYIAEQMSFTAYDKLRENAKGEVAGSPPNLKAIKDYIRSKKSARPTLNALEKVNFVDSTMDVVSKISNAIPSSNNINVDIQDLIIKDSDVYIEGFVKSLEEKKSLEASLRSVALAQKLNLVTPKKTTPKDKVSFAYSFKVERTEASQ